MTSVGITARGSFGGVHSTPTGFAALPYEIRMMIFKKARQNAFKARIYRFNLIMTERADGWSDIRLNWYFQMIDRRSAAEEEEALRLWR